MADRALGAVLAKLRGAGGLREKPCCRAPSGLARLQSEDRDRGDIGIWHETYLVPAGSYESIYSNMPRFGLAVAGDQLKLGLESTAAIRTGTRPDDEAPVQAY